MRRKIGIISERRISSPNIPFQDIIQKVARIAIAKTDQICEALSSITCSKAFEECAIWINYYCIKERFNLCLKIEMHRLQAEWMQISTKIMSNDQAERNGDYENSWKENAVPSGYPALTKRSPKARKQRLLNRRSLLLLPENSRIRKTLIKTCWRVNVYNFTTQLSQSLSRDAISDSWNSSWSSRAPIAIEPTSVQPIPRAPSPLFFNMWGDGGIFLWVWFFM